MKNNSSPFNIEVGFKFILGAAFTSGIMAPIGKVVLGRISSPVFLLYMVSVAGLIGWLMSMWAKQPLKLGIKPEILGALFKHTICAVVALFGLWEGMKYLNPGVAAFVSNSQVLFTFISAWIILGERLRLVLLPAAIVVGSGMAIMTYDADSGFRQSSLIGVGYILLSSLAFSLSDIVIKQKIEKITLLPFITIRNFLMTLIYGVWVIAADLSLAIDLQTFLLIVCSAILGPILARWFFSEGLRTLEAGLSILVFQTYPFFAAVFSYWILGDLMSAQQWIGGALILSGVTMMVRLSR